MGRLDCRRGSFVTALAAVALLASCTDDGPAADDPSSTTETTVAETTTTTEPLAAGTLDAVELELELAAELDEPIALAARPGSPDLYIAEKGGRVRLIEVEDEDANTGTSSSTTTEPPDEGEGLKVDTDVYQEQRTPLLDISDDVINEGERGLLGMTFSSDGRKLYLDYTRQPDGHTVIVEYTLGDSQRIDRASRRELLVVEQPFDDHSGGQLVIGPDGYLYIGLGDGGSQGEASGNGQDTSTLLGSILRIDPEGGGGDGPAYHIPPGNPFADGEDGKPEIWLYGVRNPWRFTFDTVTGDLWVGDVGADDFEEIDRLPATGGFDAGRGDNLGWNEMEGTHPFEGGENPPGGVLPIFEYGRDQGCAVIGGYVYRGQKIPALQGTYLYTDSCGTGLRGLQTDRGVIIDERAWALDAREAYSFGQDDAGELYLLLAGGQVLKVEAA